jgi:hypothetical protein
MTQTTTYVNACDVSIWLDNAAGTAKDISGSSNKIDMAFTREIGELRTFQVKWPVRLGCGKDAEFTLTAVYSTATDEAMDILKNWWFADDPGLRTLHVYIPDKNVGSDHFYGEVTIGDLSIPADPTEPGPIAVEAVLLPSGAFTLTTTAT